MRFGPTSVEAAANLVARVDVSVGGGGGSRQRQSAAGSELGLQTSCRGGGGRRDGMAGHNCWAVLTVSHRVVRLARQQELREGTRD